MLAEGMWLPEKASGDRAQFARPKVLHCHSADFLNSDFRQSMFAVCHDCVPLGSCHACMAHFNTSPPLHILTRLVFEKDLLLVSCYGSFILLFICILFFFLRETL